MNGTKTDQIRRLANFEDLFTRFAGDIPVQLEENMNKTGPYALWTKGRERYEMTTVKPHPMSPGVVSRCQRRSKNGPSQLHWQAGPLETLAQGTFWMCGLFPCNFSREARRVNQKKDTF